MWGRRWCSVWFGGEFSLRFQLDLHRRDFNGELKFGEFWFGKRDIKMGDVDRMELGHHDLGGLDVGEPEWSWIDAHRAADKQS